MFVISKTHVGMVRTVNEDALLTTGPELFALADGMGASSRRKPPAGKPYRFCSRKRKNLRSLLAPSYAPPCVKQCSRLISISGRWLKMKYSIMIWARRSWQYIWRQTVSYAVNVGDSRLYTWSARHFTAGHPRSFLRRRVIGQRRDHCTGGF